MLLVSTLSLGGAPLSARGFSNDTWGQTVKVSEGDGDVSLNLHLAPEPAFVSYMTITIISSGVWCDSQYHRWLSLYFK